MAQYTLDLGDTTDELLARWAEKKQVIKAELLRRALATYIYLIENGPEVGLKVSITDAQDNVVKDIELP